MSELKQRVRRPPKGNDLTEEHLDRMNIGRRYWSATLQGIQPGVHRDAIQLYLRDWENNWNTGWGVFLWGANSVGKTFAAAAILKELSRRGHSCYCVLSDVLKSAYIDGQRFDPEQSIVQRVESVDVLVLEDLGKEYSGKGSGWAELCFENMIRKRSRNLLPTLITTNLDPKSFRDRYDKSAASIAMESMISVEVKGTDMRRAAAIRKTTEYQSQRRK
jgi:DNA replication protein DnaC